MTTVFLFNLPKHSRLHVANTGLAPYITERREIRRSTPLAMAALPLAARQVRGATHTSREGSVSGDPHDLGYSRSITNSAL